MIIMMFNKRNERNQHHHHHQEQQKMHLWYYMILNLQLNINLLQKPVHHIDQFLQWLLKSMDKYSKGWLKQKKKRNKLVDIIDNIL